jgi:hypothetical protein
MNTNEHELYNRKHSCSFESIRGSSVVLCNELVDTAIADTPAMEANA